jgi:hypothetical protein
MAISRNHCCNGNSTERSVHIVEVHVTVNNITIWSVAEQCRRLVYEEIDVLVSGLKSNLEGVDRHSIFNYWPLLNFNTFNIYIFISVGPICISFVLIYALVYFYTVLFVIT